MDASNEAGSTFPEQVSLHLREATARRRQKDYNGAVAALRQAFEEAKRANCRCTITQLIRLPTYLHAAGKQAEAWREYQTLLTDHPRQSTDREQLYFGLAEIYGGMAASYAREKRYREQVIHALLGYVYRGIGKHYLLQRLERTAEEFRRRSPGVKNVHAEIALNHRTQTEEEFSAPARAATVEALLKKTGLEGSNATLVAVLDRVLPQIPAVNVAGFVAHLNEALPTTVV